jgi:hypothetical protein
LILDSHGSVLSFGYNHDGQLGHSGKISKNIPEMIPNLVDIVQIFCAGFTSIVKNDSHQYFVFGFNASYLPENENILTPVEQENWRGKIIFPGGGPRATKPGEFPTNGSACLIFDAFWNFGKFTFISCFPGYHIVILDEEGFLSFLGTDPDFVLKASEDCPVRQHLKYLLTMKNNKHFSLKGKYESSRFCANTSINILTPFSFLVQNALKS